MYNEGTENRTFDIRQRSFQFGVKIVLFIRTFPKDTAGFAIGNQLIRSGTSVGANIEEGQNASSRKDFIHCLTISLKEARETEYWLKIIQETKLIIHEDLVGLLQEINELIKILTTIIKKSKEKL
ncbi:MAG: four helix bundle protein [Candidatus Levybacteria bacterium]|nr:four helix bundle protein [Candidatus Levybacteria bacterium]